jgi:uncharacterized SAM-binding protein YcdF (DUF218 family)
LRLLGKVVRLLVVVIVVALALYVGSPFILAALGRYLVTSHPTRTADLAVVLAGEPFLRVPAAARLYHDGLVPAILLMAGKRPPGLDDLRGIGIRYPDDGEISLGILEGLRVPRAAVRQTPDRVDSTAEQAAAVARFLNSHPARAVTLVTSKSHSTRSYKIFRDGLPREVQLAVHAAPADPFDADRWWRTPGYLRQVVHEYLGLTDYWGRRAWAALTGWIATPAVGPVRVAIRRG